jgi:hypothetical protein
MTEAKEFSWTEETQFSMPVRIHVSPTGETAAVEEQGCEEFDGAWPIYSLHS